MKIKHNLIGDEAFEEVILYIKINLRKKIILNKILFEY